MRDLLLDNLKERVQEVAVLAADGAWAGGGGGGGAPGGGGAGVPLTEDEIAVTQLCAAVEQCLLHGMRRAEFGGVLPFWACLERLERACAGAGAERALRNTVAAVSLAATLRTPVGRARGWVRQALNARALEASVGALLRDDGRAAGGGGGGDARKALVLPARELFWEPRALMRSPEAELSLVPLLGALGAFAFALDIEVRDLNACLLYTSPSPRDGLLSRMPSSA